MMLYFHSIFFEDSPETKEILNFETDAPKDEKSDLSFHPPSNLTRCQLATLQ